MAVRILADDQRRDDVIMVCETEQEREFLALYREADAAGKRRIEKVGCAIRDGLMPSAEKIKAMTRVELCAFVDTLPAARL